MDKFIAKNLLKYKGTWYETGAEVPVEGDEVSSLVADGTLEQIKTNLHNDDKNGVGAGEFSPVPIAPETAEYAEKTNADQLAYLQTLGDEDFKAQAQALLLISKSKSKTYIERRLKDLTEVVE